MLVSPDVEMACTGVHQTWQLLHTMTLPIQPMLLAVTYYAVFLTPAIVLPWPLLTQTKSNTTLSCSIPK